MIDPVVLLPGLQSGANSWLPLIDRLGRHWPLSVPMGHQFETDTAAMARSVLHQSPARFHLVAWSMGGYVALEVLHQAPERLLSLTLMATSARAEAPDNFPRRDAALERARTGGLAHYQAVNLESCFFDLRALSPDLRARLLATSEALGVGALERQTKAIKTRPDRRETLARCDLPVLIVAGDADLIVDPANAAEMHALCPHSTLRMIPNCGHCPPQEKPDETTEILNGFLRSLAPADRVASA